MAEQKSTLTIIKENIKKANAYDSCIEDNVKITNNCTEVKSSLCYISKEFLDIIATLSGNTTKEIVSQESIKGVRPKSFEVLKNHCDIAGGVPLKQEPESTTYSMMFSEKEDGLPVTRAETYKLKATAYDGCIKEKTMLKDNYTECKTSLGYFSKEYFFTIALMFEEGINEMDSQRREGIIKPEHYTIIKKHCGSSILNTTKSSKDDSEKQEENNNIQHVVQGINTPAGEITSREEHDEL